MENSEMEDEEQEMRTVAEDFDRHHGELTLAQSPRLIENHRGSDSAWMPPVRQMAAAGIAPAIHRANRAMTAVIFPSLDRYSNR